MTEGTGHQAGYGELRQKMLKVLQHQRSTVRMLKNYSNYLREKNIDIENVLSEFTTKEIIDESKQVISEYFNKSIESIYSLKNHELFPILENINNYLINRTN